MFALIVIACYIAYTFPTAPGDNYEPNHVSNLYLPKFGTSSEHSTLPDAGTTLLTFYTIRSVLMLVSLGQNPELLFSAFYVLDVIARFVAYVTLFGMIEAMHKYRLLLSVLFTMEVTFPGIPVLLLVLTVSKLSHLAEAQQRNLFPQSVLIIVVCFTTNALYWHSYSFVSFVMVSAFIFTSTMLVDRNRPRTHVRWLNLFFILATITAASWIFLRERSALSISLLGLMESGRLLNWETFQQGLFGRGAFIPISYQFKYQFFVDVRILDVIRYGTYVLAYAFVIGELLAHFRRKRNASSRSCCVIFAVLLLTDAITKVAHYLVARTVGADVWLVFLYPMILASTMGSGKGSPRYRVIPNSRRILMLLFLTIVLVTTLFSAYVTHTQLASRTTQLEDYSASLSWIVDNRGSVDILADADTAGYYQVLYTSRGLTDAFAIENQDMSFDQYNQLESGNYTLPEGTLIALNVFLYENHIAFGSLQYWNVFEPMSPKVVELNKLNRICDDGFIQIIGS